MAVSAAIHDKKMVNNNRKLEITYYLLTHQMIQILCGLYETSCLLSKLVLMTNECSRSWFQLTSSRDWILFHFTPSVRQFLQSIVLLARLF